VSKKNTRRQEDPIDCLVNFGERKIREDFIFHQNQEQPHWWRLVNLEGNQYM